MEYWLLNQDEDQATRAENGTVVVRTGSPFDHTKIHVITTAIRCKLWELIRAEKECCDWELLPLLASLPPDSGASGCEYYVHADMFAMLGPMFESIVWKAIRNELGSELD